MTTVRLGFFSPSPVTVLGHQLGVFADHGIDLIELPVTSSVDQMTRLAAGEFDVVLTSPDNVLAYRLSSATPLRRRLDVGILRSVDCGMGLALLASDATAIDELRGQAIAVDVPHSGFAFALDDILGRGGLQRDRDYELVSLGSTPARLLALTEGRCAATLLNAGSDIAAVALGAHRVADVVDVLGPYLGSVIATTTTARAAAPDAVAAFLSAWEQATLAALDPAHRSALVAAAASAATRLPVAEQIDDLTSVAEQIADTVTDPRRGLCADGAVDPQALATVIGLRHHRAGFDDGVPIDELLAGDLTAVSV